MFPIPLLVTGLPALPRPLLSLSHPVSSLWLLAYVSSYLPPTLSLALAHALPIPASPPILYTSFPVLSSKTYVALVMTDSSSFLVPLSIAVAVSPKSSLPIFLTFAQTFLYSYQTHPPYPPLSTSALPTPPPHPISLLPLLLSLWLPVMKLVRYQSTLLLPKTPTPSSSPSSLRPLVPLVTELHPLLRPSSPYPVTPSPTPYPPLPYYHL